MTQFSNSRYDLEERTAKFGEDIIELCKGAPHTLITSPIISQLLRSATSIGANYVEATATSSKKDFRNKIFICKKEAQETKHWLRMLAKALLEKQDEIGCFWKETQELTLILQKITNTLNQ